MSAIAPSETTSFRKPGRGAVINASLLFGYDFFISFTLGP